MRKSDLKFMTSLIEQANPLKLINEDGSSKVFYTLKEAYVYVLGQIYGWAAITFIDVEFVLSKIYKKKYSDVHSIFMSYFKPLGIDSHVQLTMQVREKKRFLRDFVRAMHSYCETTFDTNQFDAAFTEFVASLEEKLVIKSRQELEEEKQKKTIQQ